MASLQGALLGLADHLRRGRRAQPHALRPSAVRRARVRQRAEALAHHRNLPELGLGAAAHRNRRSKCAALRCTVVSRSAAVTAVPR
jgi:hypothetical protein